MKQTNLFGSEFVPQDEDNNYNKKIQSPVYIPKGQRPHIMELCNKSKTHRLMKEIEASSLPFEEKNFLMDAARGHSVFNYEKIADYYAHASPEMQALMEKSALVIIDFEKAIQLGYVKVCEDIRNQYLEEYGEGE